MAAKETMMPAPRNRRGMTLDGSSTTPMPAAQYTAVRYGERLADAGSPSPSRA